MPKWKLTALLTAHLPSAQLPWSTLLLGVTQL